jgi:hypothetical protein
VRCVTEEPVWMRSRLIAARMRPATHLGDRLVPGSKPVTPSAQAIRSPFIPVLLALHGELFATQDSHYVIIRQRSNRCNRSSRVGAYKPDSTRHGSGVVCLLMPIPRFSTQVFIASHRYNIPRQCLSLALLQEPEGRYPYVSVLSPTTMYVICVGSRVLHA